MKNQLLLFLAINFLFVVNSFSQSFYGSSDVISYSSGKVFSNNDKTVKIQIGYDGITVNGNLAYFNLEISVLSTSVALIKGYSLSNPDGTISFRLNSSTGCIVQGSDSYCSTNSTSNTTTTTSSKTKFQTILPDNFKDEKKNRLHFDTYGTGTLYKADGTEVKFKWTEKNDNELVLTRVDNSTTLYTLKLVLSGLYENDFRFTYLEQKSNGTVIKWSRQ
jgi:hypothetical protein